MKFHCFGNWHLIEVINYIQGLNYHERDLMSFHFIFVTNFICDKNPLYSNVYDVTVK